MRAMRATSVTPRAFARIILAQGKRAHAFINSVDYPVSPRAEAEFGAGRTFRRVAAPMTMPVRRAVSLASGHRTMFCPFRRR